MKICLPVDRPVGLDSAIFPSFRSAPALLVVDTANGDYQAVDSSGGACRSMPAPIDAVVYAGGMGRGLFNGLRSRGVRVFASEAATVAEALAQLAAGRLQEVREVAGCGGGQPHGDQPSAAHGGCGCGGHHGERAGGGCGCRH